MTSDARLELHRLVSALCDGVLTDAELARLEELLLADEEHRRFYLEYADMHARLLGHPRLRAGDASQAPSAGTPKLVGGAGQGGREQAGRRWSAQALRYGLVAALTLAASLLIQVAWWGQQRPAVRPEARPAPKGAVPVAPGYVATLRQAVGCEWEGPSPSLRDGTRLPPGLLTLRRGFACVGFDGGTELLVEGPAQLRLETSAAATILRGKVVFRTDETAGPFELHTPSSTLTDVGTEYAVAVEPEGEEVHVFDGEVVRTPTASAASAEHLTAGEARRYDQPPDGSGRPVRIDPRRFVRQIADRASPFSDPSAGLLAYEGFDYKDPEALSNRQASGGSGWSAPWVFDFARLPDRGKPDRHVLNVAEGLVRPGTEVDHAGGSFDYTGFTKVYRRLAEPIRLDTDGVYYLRFLFRRGSPSSDPINALAVLLRTDEEFRKDRYNPRLRLNIGVGGASNELFTHLHRRSSRTPLPLAYGETYLLVAKVAASGANADQVFIRVYGSDEQVGREEPGSWAVVGPLLNSNLVFDWVELHINSRSRQTIDELRIGQTWASVTAPWSHTPRGSTR